MAKPRKVQEPAGTYTAKTPAKQAPAAPAQKTAAHQVRDLDDVTAQKLADKIFSERKDLLRKLALAEKSPSPTTPDTAQSTVRYARNKAVQKENEKLMHVHQKVLQKLAQ